MRKKYVIRIFLFILCVNIRLDGFNFLFRNTLYSSEALSARINDFRNHPESVSKSSINYAILKTFEYLINPTRETDPTGVFRSVFRGTSPINSFVIDAEHGWNIIWRKSPYPSNLNRITLSYPTIAQFFGNDFSTIQPALYYTERNLQDNVAHTGYVQALNIPGLLTSEFIARIDHLYNKFYKIFSTEYADGQQLTVTFHQDTSHGIHEDSILFRALKDDTQSKFKDLIDKDSKSLTVTIRKDGNDLANIQEIVSIVFYIVMFNSIAIFQEDGGLFSMIASQRELFTTDYIFQLGAKDLSQIGKQILSSYQLGWNRNDENKVVWNYGDCWPIYLFNDARELMKWFSGRYMKGAGIIKLS
jgi:hypothetical protein